MITISNNIKTVIKITIGVLVLLLLFWLGGDWARTKLITALGGYTEIETKETIDTTSVEYDTIYMKYDKLFAKVDSLLTRKETSNYIHTYKETIIQKDGTTKEETRTEILPLVYTHENPISDTLINGIIKTIINPADCKILYQDLQYKAKFPNIVSKTITIEKTKESTLTKDKRALLGVGLNVNSDRSAGIVGAYQFKNNTQIQLNYNKNFDTRIEVDRPKDVFGVTLIKFF